MTNYNERLDKILSDHGAEQGEFHYSLKQAILDWHNKQVEEVLELAKEEAFSSELSFELEDGRIVIEIETDLYDILNRLKEVK